jgi:hypothetical protein
MITLNHTVYVEVDFETLSDAETFHDAIRDFIREYQFHCGLELEDHSDTGITDRH